MKKLRLMSFVILLSIVSLGIVACGADNSDNDNNDKVDVTLSSIAVTTQPTKTEYIVGETFSSAGLVVTATYSDSSTKAVPNADLTISTPDMSTVGTKTVNVEYEQKTANFTITVSEGESEATLSSIAVTTQPTKTEYIVGETFSSAGLVVTATYSDSTTQVVPIAELTISTPDMNTVGSQDVTVTYEQKTTSFEITIVEDTVVDATVVYDNQLLIDMLTDFNSKYFNQNPNTTVDIDFDEFYVPFAEGAITIDHLSIDGDHYSDSSNYRFGLGKNGFAYGKAYDVQDDVLYINILVLSAYNGEVNISGMDAEVDINANVESEQLILDSIKPFYSGASKGYANEVSYDGSIDEDNDKIVVTQNRAHGAAGFTLEFNLGEGDPIVGISKQVRIMENGDRVYNFNIEQTESNSTLKNNLWAYGTFNNEAFTESSVEKYEWTYNFVGYSKFDMELIVNNEQSNLLVFDSSAFKSSFMEFHNKYFNNKIADVEGLYVDVARNVNNTISTLEIDGQTYNTNDSVRFGLGMGVFASDTQPFKIDNDGKLSIANILLATLNGDVEIKNDKGEVIATIDINMHDTDTLSPLEIEDAYDRANTAAGYVNDVELSSQDGVYTIVQNREHNAQEIKMDMNTVDDLIGASRQVRLVADGDDVISFNLEQNQLKGDDQLHLYVQGTWKNEAFTEASTEEYDWVYNFVGFEQLSLHLLVNNNVKA